MRLKTNPYNLVVLLVLKMFFFLGTSFHVQGQIPSFTNYTTRDGLLSNTIYGSVVDDNGFIWFATNFGIAQFDGYKFRTFDKKDGLPDNEIFGFFVDSKNRMWFRTFNGSVGYFKNGEFYNEDNLLFKNANPIKGLVKEITEDKDGNIYFSSLMNQIVKLDAELRFSIIEHDFKNALLIRNKKKEAIIANRQNAQKVNFHDANSLMQKSLSLTELEEELYHLLPNLSLEVKNRYVNALYGLDLSDDEEYYVKLHRGVYWKYSVNLPLIKCERKDKELIELVSVPSLKANKAIVDDEDNLWFCTLENGIYKLDQEIEFNLSSDAINKEDNFTTMYVDANDIYIGTTRGEIYDFSERDLKLKAQSTLPEDSKGTSRLKIRKIKKSINNKFYVGKDHGLYKYDNDFNEEAQLPMTFKDLNFLDSRLVVSTFSSGLICAQDSIQNVEDIYNSRSTSNFIDSQGNVWFGSNKGIVMFTPDLKLYWEPKESVLRRITVNDISETSNGEIVIATNGEGLITLDKKLNISNHINSENGMMNDFVNHIYVDEKDNVWASTNQGICKITLQQGGQYSLRTFSQNLGFSSHDVLQSKVIDDFLFVLSSTNLSCINLNRLVDQPYSKPNLNMDEIWVNGKKVSQNKLKDLKHFENEMKFNYSSVSINHAYDLEFKYRLLGSSNQWKTTKERQLHFEGLSPRSYTLEIYPHLPQNMSDEKSAMISLPFIIKPRWYNNNWIRIGFICCFLLGLYFWITRRLEAERLKHKYALELTSLKQKALLMEMNPHFINNCLSSIQNFVLQGDKREASSYLNKFARLIRVILSDSRKEEVSIEKEIEHISLYLELEQLRFSNKFQFEIVNNLENYNAKFIPTMMIQPLIENGIMHAFDFSVENYKEIKILFYENAGYLRCVVKDNGMGLEKSSHRKKQNSSGIALVNITKRIEHMQRDYPKANFKIESYNDNNQTGTMAILNIPLIQKEKV